MNNTEKLMLIGSLEKKFHSSETFMSYPLHDLNYFKSEDLSALFNGISSTESLRLAAEFSRKIHQIPNSKVFEGDNTLPLWNLYKDVLQYAELARNNEVKIEQSKIPEQIVLMEKEYLKYEQAYFNLVKQYQEDKITNKEDANWITTLEPFWERKIATLEQEWINKGNKHEVDQYYFQLMLKKGNSFTLIWKSWKDRFIEDLHIKSDLDGGRFASFQLYPNPKDTKWSLFEADDVKSLMERVPKNIKEVFYTEDVKWVDSISYEYLKVNISRPWFNPILFSADFWKLDKQTWPYPDRNISDGPQSLKGICPAYVSDFILVRNFKIVYRKTFIEKIVREMEAGVEKIGQPLDWLLNLLFPNKKDAKTEDEPFECLLMAYGSKYISKAPNPDMKLKWNKN